jgi:NADPH:quinone reductase-like Zn-dependent oxidoreductase/aryl carrier-like protein
VGLAAIQVARSLGAEIFATAGSPEKREYLRLLGVPHIMDSRSLSFGDEIMAATGGEGVHVVLNSVAGDGLRESMRVLTRFGRFLEIGKHDFVSNSQLGMRLFERCASFHSVDVTQLLLDKPLTRSLLAEIAALVSDGVYRPLPYRAFPASQAVAAFRQLQQARHIGKLLISMRGEHSPSAWPAPPDEQAREPFAARPDGTYVISGGLGGFGLATARWLTEHGARHLVLAGRSGAATPEAERDVAGLRAMGAEVLVARADVSRAEQVADLFATVRASMPPVRGVIHAAMVLDDGLLRGQDAERLDKAMAPKILGAWHLHEQTLAQPLDFFVLFSSFTSVTGNLGQGNYVAGNAFLDSFAAFRRARGLPALTINWGGIGQVGYLVQAGEDTERIIRRGISPMDPGLALDVMGRLLQEGQVRAAIADIDWTLAAALWQAETTRAAHLLASTADGAQDGQKDGLALRVLSAGPDEQQNLVAAWLADCLARVLGSSADAIDPQRSLAGAGLDSLMAMELHIRIEQDLGVDVPVLGLMQAGCLADVAAAVSGSLRSRVPEAAA